MARALTAKQQRFVDVYLATLSQTEAYRTAYDTQRMQPASVHVKAHELMNVPHVAVAIAERQAAKAKEWEITTDRVLAELAIIAFADMRDYCHWKDGAVEFSDADDLGARTRAVKKITRKDKVLARINKGTEAIIERTVTLELHDKKGALVDLGKHLNLFEQAKRPDDPNTRPLMVINVGPSQQNIQQNVQNRAKLAKPAHENGPGRANVGQ